MNADDRDDTRLERLLRAVRAEAEPALWTRVRARIEARERTPAWLRWSMRPAALAVSMALFLATAGLTMALVRPVEMSAATNAATLTEALIGADDDAVSFGEAVTSATTGGAVRDTGGHR
jgi:hypothetical protein